MKNKIKWSLIFSRATSITMTLLTILSTNPSLYAGEEYFQRRNLIGRDFGLKSKEMVLTFDDGPGVDTPRLLRVFSYFKIPATFFFVGNSIKSNRKNSEEVFKLIKENDDLFTIGNHTVAHHNLYQLGNPAVGQELVWAHELIKESQTLPYTFFRAPFGNFNKIMADFLNNNPAYTQFSASYIGPVFWDIGGFTENNAYIGDWTCWTKSYQAKIGELAKDIIGHCKNGHFNEIRKMGTNPKRTSGMILLAHDVHRNTVKMFIGDMDVDQNGKLINENKDSLLHKLMGLSSEGFKFVRLDEYPEKIEKLLELPLN